MTPEPTLVRRQLEHILASETFATASRHSRLLRYLVERTLAGEGDQLKEYVLGTEVFDRSDSYDPRLDSIVRVEVRRLRTRLEDYYRGPGAGEPVVIDIPRGSYVPLFSARPEATDTAPPAALPTSDAPDRQSQPSAFRAIAAALTIAVLVLTASFVLDRNRAPAEAASGPGIAVLPLEHYSSDPDDVLMVARLTDEITAALARVGTVSVASRTSAVRLATGPDRLSEIAALLDVDYVLEGSATITGNGLRVMARLVDATRDRKIWVEEYRAAEHEIAVVAKQIASDAAAAALKTRLTPATTSP